MGHFEHRKYSVLIALGKPAAPPLFCRDTWLRLVPMLDPLVRSAKRGPEAVHSTQNDQQGRPIKFGRMRWNAQSHSRWTLDCSQPSSIAFGATELWAPSRNVCAKEDLAPDVYIDVVNAVTIQRNGLLVAVCHDVITSDTDRQIDDVARACKVLLNKPLLARTERYWGRSVLNDFRGAIQDYWGQVVHALRDGADGATIASLPGKWVAALE